MKRQTRTWLIYNLMLLLAAAAITVYLLLLRGAQLPFRCAFSAQSHLYCPGCGCTRALEALLRFDLLSSLSANPMVLWLLLTLLYYEVAFFLSMRRKTVRVSSKPAIIFAYALLAHAVLRNLLLVFGGIDPLGDLIQHWR
ncbi:MAG: DUF2752 domain-containing protein [Clostridia bacterium]|nr:DUF2752 domain-containing protein [Clostridia bacterium]